MTHIRTQCRRTCMARHARPRLSAHQVTYCASISLSVQDFFPEFQRKAEEGLKRQRRGRKKGGVPQCPGELIGGRFEAFGGGISACPTKLEAVLW